MGRWLRSIVGAVACLVAATGLPVACGGSEDPAGEVLRQTFRDRGARLHGGYLSLSVRLIPGGSHAAGGPVTFTLLGPFAGPRRAGELARFDLELATTTDDSTSVAQVRSTGSRIHTTRHGSGHAVADALGARLGRATRAAPTTGLPVIGLHPARWIRKPRKRREERAAGVATVRVGGTVDVARLLEDVAGLLADAGTSPTAAVLLSAKLRSVTADAADWSVIDIWTGASDRLLRQISARVDFSFRPRSTPPAAARRATLEVHVRLDDVH